ncbi:protein E12 [Elephant endotheliotropic herpesvirus 1A]|uniref:Membrane protein EE37 n=2 Tax=Elephantid herpesvirus 1 TaxID=146015 RepID=M4JTY6_ELHV1|nr:membrane protein EE37 [Elephantid betaherpesvirus 1]QEY96098.1 membrane protein EE37 [Elephant endotheliotropic herpesvirus 1A]AGE09888.1 membrane protein EE37 [Elephantid betaherpesvirus 1]AGE09997.1 membrane protein EE37 [Elephantid betaherpesvirus 1]QOE74534.1 protein E12 [Elephant endotheliotropic herpesvirus 1A]QOE74889.1 protein E12 [Elephant endotheliotropic herpesvirus 1A]
MDSYTIHVLALPLFLFINAVLCCIFRRQSALSLLDPVLVLVIPYFGTRLLAAKKAEHMGLDLYFHEDMFLNGLMIAYYLLIGVFSLIYTFYLIQQWRGRVVDTYFHLLITMFSRRVLPYFNLLLYNINLHDFMTALVDDYAVMERLSYMFLYLGIVLVVSEICDSFVDFPPRFSWFWTFMACGMLCFHQRHLIVNTRTSFNANILSFSVIIYILSKMLYEFDLVVRFH